MDEKVCDLHCVYLCLWGILVAAWLGSLYILFCIIKGGMHVTKKRQLNELLFQLCSSHVSLILKSLMNTIYTRTSIHIFYSVQHTIPYCHHSYVLSPPPVYEQIKEVSEAFSILVLNLFQREKHANKQMRKEMEDSLPVRFGLHELLFHFRMLRKRFLPIRAR
jgi:hypothetical protein